MRCKSRKIVTLLLFLAIALVPLIIPVSAQGSASLPDQMVNNSPSRMEVGVFVNSIENLDFIKGTYSMDYYLHFRWTDPRIQAAHFEIMNGLPSIGSHSLEKISEDKTGPVKEEWYRISADFTRTPDVRDYPFESGILPVQIEDAENNATQLIYVPLEEDSGIDPQFSIPGWSIGSPVFSVINHSYPWGETYSLLSFNIPITKNATDSIIQTLIPPLIFCFIASFSFFIRVEHSELVHLRYILTTSMFITAVLYHYSEFSGLVGLGVLKLFDKYMIAIYLYLAATIVVTTLCYLAQWDWKRPDLVKPINRYGMLISILVPVVSFWLLMVLL